MKNGKRGEYRHLCCGLSVLLTVILMKPEIGRGVYHSDRSHCCFIASLHGKIFLRTPQKAGFPLAPRPLPPKALVLLQLLPRSILSRVWWRWCISQHRVCHWLVGCLGSAWHLLRKERRRITGASRREHAHGYWRSDRQGLGSVTVG
jgi:hypothetical protein